jgi:hypothetical protein
MKYLIALDIMLMTSTSAISEPLDGTLTCDVYPYNSKNVYSLSEKTFKFTDGFLMEGTPPLLVDNTGSIYEWIIQGSKFYSNVSYFYDKDTNYGIVTINQANSLPLIIYSLTCKPFEKSVK